MCMQAYSAKLSDFGLAKLGPVNGNSHVTTRIMGTYGYAAPEYVATGNYSLFFYFFLKFFMRATGNYSFLYFSHILFNKIIHPKNILALCLNIWKGNFNMVLSVFTFFFVFLGWRLGKIEAKIHFRGATVNCNTQKCWIKKILKILSYF